MKRIYLFLFALIAMMLAPKTVSAEEFTVDGVTYSTVGSKQAWINGVNSSVQSLRVNSTVTNNGKTYDILGVWEYACQNNTTLSNVYFNGENTMSVESHAFYNCTNLEHVVFTNVLDGFSIEQYAFYGCSKLIEVALPNNMDHVAERAFASCTNLVHLTINKLNELHYYAFENSPITLITWKNTSTMTVKGGSTGNSPFYLNKSTIGHVEAYADIQNDLFRDMQKLTTLNIYSGVKNIGNNSFNNCTKLTNLPLTYAKDLETIGDFAFSNAPIANDLDFYYSTSKLKSIGMSAFRGAKSSKIYLGNKVSNSPLTIGAYAFADCSALYNLRIEGYINAAGIDKNAFNGSTAYYLTITPENYSAWKTDYASAADSPFAGLKHLKDVTIKVNRVGNNMFNGASELQKISVSSAQSIGDNAFEKAGKLSSVTLPNGLTSIGDWAFEGTALTSVTIPSSVTEIGSGAFDNLSISSVILPDGLKTLGSHAFDNTNIKEVIIPENVEKIGSNVFPDLDKLTYNAVNATYDGGMPYPMFKGAKSVEIGSKVTAIPDYMFRTPTSGSFTSITLPQSLQKIGNVAFEGSYLKEISLPSNIQSLGNGAFSSCASLKTLTISGNVPAPGSSFLSTTLSTIYCNCNNESDVRSKWTSVCSNIVPQGAADYTLPEIDDWLMTGKGTVEWGAANGCDPNRTLTAKPNTAEGYEFVRWSDGETANPRTINLQTFEKIGVFYAIFAAESDYTKLNVVADPNAGATFKITDNEGREHNDAKFLVEEGERIAVITPTIKSGYEFIEWVYDDIYQVVEEDQETHVLTITMEYFDELTMMGTENVAHFPIDYTLRVKEPVVVTTAVNNSAMGAAHAGNNYDGTWDIWAYANFGYEFLGWDDNGDGTIDNTEDHRTVSPDKSTTYTAYFKEEEKKYNIYAAFFGCGDAELVREEGSLLAIPAGEKATLYVKPAQGTRFKGWYDTNFTLISTENPYVIESVDQDYSFTVEIECYDPSSDSHYAIVTAEEGGRVTTNVTLNSENDAEQTGYVPQNFDFILTATPDLGYEFVGWEYMLGNADVANSTQNPLTLHTPPYNDNEIINIVVTAHFRVATGVENIEKKTDSEVRKVLRNGQVLIIRNGKTYNILGTLIENN